MLFTSHRSGSTWLSDAIRCHPAVDYLQSSAIYEALDINGRRYPGDLSNLADCVYEIEVHPGKCAKIPRFDISEKLNSGSANLNFNGYAIEKCHPSFFEFDSETFEQKVGAMEENGSTIKMVYLVRDPKSLMTSFLNYQSRKPTWYKHVVGDKLPKLIQQTYECIAQAISCRPGVVLDYSDTKTDLAYALVTIYMSLWPNLSTAEENEILQVSELAKDCTDRTARMSRAKTPFLGKVEGKIYGDDIQYELFFKEHVALVNRCYESYHKVLKSRSSRFIEI